MYIMFYKINQEMFNQLFLIPLQDTSAINFQSRIYRATQSVKAHMLDRLMKASVEDYNESRMVGQCHLKEIEKIANALGTDEGYQILKSMLRHYKLSRKGHRYYEMKYNKK